MGSATSGADLVTSSPLEEPRHEVSCEDIETSSLRECSQLLAAFDESTFLDESTKEVIGGILTTFRSMSEASIGRSSSEESLFCGVFLRPAKRFCNLRQPSESSSSSSSRSSSSLSGEYSLLRSSEEFFEGILGADKVISSSERLNLAPNEIIRDLSTTEFERRGTHAVRNILIKSSESVTSGVSQGSSTTSTARTDSAAVDIFSTVVDGVKILFQRGQSPSAVGLADSGLLPGSIRDPEVSESVSKADISSIAQRLYNSLRQKLRKFLSSQKQPHTETQVALAKKSISQILGVVQEDMSKSDQLNRTGELLLVGTMLENLETTTSPTSTQSSQTLRSEKTLEDMSFTLPGTPSPSELQKVISCPIVRSSIIDCTGDDDLHDQNDSMLESSSAGARDSMAAIVETILSPAELQQASAPLDRLEELLSEGKVQALSRDLVDRLKSLMLEQGKDHVGTGKSHSDSALLEHTQRGSGTRGPSSSAVIHAFAEESVKRLLATLLVPSTSWGLDQKASSSSSQVYEQTVSLFTTALVQQVTVNLEETQSATCPPSPTLFGTGGCQSSVKASGSVESGSVSRCVSPSGSEAEATQAEPKVKKRSRFVRFFKGGFKSSKKSQREVSPDPEEEEEPKAGGCFSAVFKSMASAIGKGLCKPFKKASRKTT